MTIIKEVEDFKKVNDGNQFIGVFPKLINSSISFSGSNNILYCEENVILNNSTLKFEGNNSIIYLCSNKYDYKLFVTVYNDNVFYMGKNNYINKTINVVLSEQKHCFIGNDCLFSLGIWIRNADPHLIYDIKTKKRINDSKSIYIGDHVWIGQNALILKGTEIDSGSIIGAMSVVSGKKINHNSSWNGNPVRNKKDNIFWDSDCVHKWNQEQTQNSQQYQKYILNRKNHSKDAYIYEYDKNQCVTFQYLENELTKNNVLEKIKQLKYITENKAKNRFVHATTKTTKNSFFIKNTKKYLKKKIGKVFRITNRKR